MSKAENNDRPPPMTAKAIAMLKRRERAVQLRTSGLTLAKVAEVIAVEFNQDSYDRSSAHRDIEFALAEDLREHPLTIDQLREMELKKLDRLQTSLWSPAIGGDIRAGTLLLKVLERRTKLLGLDVALPLIVESEVRQAALASLRQIEKRVTPEKYDEILNLLLMVR